MGNPPGKGNKGIESRVLSARLHPRNEAEQIALSVWDKVIASGYTPREVMTNALLKLGDVQTDMIHSEDNLRGAMLTIFEKLASLDALRTGVEAIGQRGENLSEQQMEELNALRRDLQVFSERGEDPGESYAKELTAMRREISELRTTFEGSVMEMLRNIRKSDPRGLRRFAEDDETEDNGTDFDPSFVRNAQRAARRSFAQTRPPSSNDDDNDDE